VDAFAFEIQDSIHHKSKTLFGVLDSMALSCSSIATQTTEPWPFQTIPTFEGLTSSFREVSGTRRISMSPLVADGEKEAWEQYSVENQGWIQESYNTIGVEGKPLDIHDVIYNIDDGIVVEAEQGPFVPLWQLSEPPKNTAVINFNLMSNSVFSSTFDIAKLNSQALFTEKFSASELLGGGDEEVKGSESLLIQPIFDDATSKNTVVGAVLAVLSWNDFMSDLVREGNRGMVVVIKNTCGQVETYSIDGSQTFFLGKGDRHDPNYDEYGYEIKIVPFSTINEETPGFCDYMAYIYPSQEVAENNKSATPALFTTLMAMLFLAAGAGFLTYDCIVQKREKEAMTSAARSNAIVSSLFPAEIRDRLFKGDVDIEAEMKAKEGGKVSSREQSAPDTQKFRLKNYLNDEDQDMTAKGSQPAAVTEAEIHATKPIADLFPNTTVLFADIAGFTAWSSVREPSQVFTLLETVYKAFDKTAKRRRVFKVETVGDCYVAVTGLPEPTKHHADVMCRFARECLTQFNELARQLEVVLGPDTGDLDIRVGIHSGPVTAGVLRGEKSRFQLFGDTVNTAARVESTGQRGKIHLSHETAELLHQAGKQNWLKKRDETVVAKGKGEMQTYWLLTEEELASGASTDEATGKGAAPLPIVRAMQPRIGANGKKDVLDPESSLPPRIKRLVDWNVDVLKRLLKQVVAKRNVSSKECYDPNHPMMMKNEVNIGCDTYVLDEVTEIIRLPGYTQFSAQDSNKIELPKKVEEQLRLYVSSIAMMHRDNPFHNFEHASHVMMSVSKLLSRIVAPDEVLNGEVADKQLSLHDHTYGITSDPLTQFSVVLAALIHDVDHSGVSNFQLIKEDAKIAKVFKNKSVAEQNSIVLAWDRLMESRFTILRSYIYSDPDELKRFRQLMVNTVLATDIFDKELQALRKNRWDTAFKHISQQVDSTPEDDVNRKATIVIEHLIQASDVAHTMQHWHIYQKWNERLFAEMTVAHQNGRMENDPGGGWYQGELGFFDNYVIPLAKKLKECGVFGVSSDEYLNYALENRREWASKGEESVARMVEKYSNKEEGDGKESDNRDKK
jgi:class 3 adenylate cyclase